MTVKDGDNSAQSRSMLKCSTIESPWRSHTPDPQIIIDFDEQVTILDVVLKPAVVAASAQSDFMNLSSLNQGDDITASFKNIR